MTMKLVCKASASKNFVKTYALDLVAINFRITATVLGVLDQQGYFQRVSVRCYH